MQLYRGMDIGTAKLTPAERRGIPHHLLDVLDVKETATVARYQSDAIAIAENLIVAGKVPVIVGGSMMYVSLYSTNGPFRQRIPKFVRSGRQCWPTVGSVRCIRRLLLLIR